MLTPTLLTRRLGTLNSSNASGTRDGIVFAATVADIGLAVIVLSAASPPAGQGEEARHLWGFATVGVGASPFTA